MILADVWKRFIGMAIQEVHAVLVRKEYSVTSGDPSEVVYRKSGRTQNVRRILRVRILDEVVYEIEANMEYPVKGSWDAKIHKRILAK